MNNSLELIDDVAQLIRTHLSRRSKNELEEIKSCAANAIEDSWFDEDFYRWVMGRADVELKIRETEKNS